MFRALGSKAHLGESSKNLQSELQGESSCALVLSWEFAESHPYSI